MKRRQQNKTVLHIDGDGFFAACEIALDPKLRGLPVVTGAERGIATAMSPEAKRLGVSRGMPVYRIRKLYPEVRVVNSNYHHYALFAARMYDIVRRFSDEVEEYSIDECFADLSGLARAGVGHADVAKAIKDTLQRELGMTFSLGLAPTKVLAKVASKWNKPDGLTIIREEDIADFLRPLKVGQIWGIGPAHSLHLHRLGVETALELAEKPENWVREHLPRPHLELWHELRGTPVYRVHSDESDLRAGRQESIQATRTFNPPSMDENLILSELSRNVESAAMRARSQGLVATRIHYFLKTQEFRYHRLELPLVSAVQTPNSIMAEISRTFDAVYEKGALYRATGVTLSGLRPETIEQRDFFGEVVGRKKWNEVMSVVDEIDRRHGTRTVILASSLNAARRRADKPKRHLIIPLMGETL